LLVAKKEIFNYYEEKNITNNENNKKKRNNKSDSLVKISVFLFSLVILLVSIVMLLRLAYISQVQYEITKLDKEINKLNERKDIEALKLEKIRESSWVEDYALNLLGMQYPSNEQIIYIDTEIKVSENEKNVALKTHDNFFFIKSIKNTFSKFLILVNTEM